MRSRPPATPDPAPEYSGSYYSGSAEEQFGSNAFWAFRNLGKILAWVGYGTVVAGIATLTVYEGAHLWIEQQMHFDQDEDAEAWGWEPERWSGGEKGGTSASLGLYGRHAVRAAWFALNYHSPFANFAVQSKGNGTGDTYGLINSDVQSARVYLESALARRNKDTNGSLRLDRVTLELLERYASVLERIGTRAALVKAGESYSLIYTAHSNDARIPRARYAVKLGNIYERIGDGKLAFAWWRQSLNLIEQADEALRNKAVATNTKVSTSSKSNVLGPVINGVTAQTGLEDKISTSTSSAVATSSKRFGKSGQLQKDDFTNSSDYITIPDLPPHSPMGQRVLITVILALSSHYTRQNRLSEAKCIQEKAISLIDLMGPSAPSGTWAEKLHRLFLLHRLSLLHVHHGEVNFALLPDGTSPGAEIGTKILTELHKAASLSEKVANSLIESAPENLTSKKKSTWTKKDAQALLRDARLTATEAWDLSGILYHRMKSDPKRASECFEQALQWAGEPGTGALSAQAWDSLLQRCKDATDSSNSN